LGDAAHASSPHHGAGAGLAIEDAAILSELLADQRVMSHKDLEAAFAVYDAKRKGRAQWLIQGSRRNGDLVEWRTEDAGRDFKQIENEINERCKTLWYVDVNRMVEEAKEKLGKILAGDAYPMW
jgi:salicylate hydroxylase